MQVHGVLESVLYASDLDAAGQFYSQVIGLTVKAHLAGHYVFFHCGPGMLLVFNPASTVHQNVLVGTAHIPPHGATGSGHLAFLIHEAELPAWRERLSAAGIPIESEISWPQGGFSIYFRDPAGNSVELATPALWGLSE